MAAILMSLCDAAKLHAVHKLEKWILVAPAIEPCVRAVDGCEHRASQDLHTMAGNCHRPFQRLDLSRLQPDAAEGATHGLTSAKSARI
jgi:hypothetical protein